MDLKAGSVARPHPGFRTREPPCSGRQGSWSRSQPERTTVPCWRRYRELTAVGRPRSDRVLVSSVCHWQVSVCSVGDEAPLCVCSPRLRCFLGVLIW